MTTAASRNVSVADAVPAATTQAAAVATSAGTITRTRAISSAAAIPDTAGTIAGTRVISSAAAIPGIAGTITHARAISSASAIPDIARTIARARTIPCTRTITQATAIGLASARKITALSTDLLACARLTVRY